MSRVQGRQLLAWAWALHSTSLTLSLPCPLAPSHLSGMQAARKRQRECVEHSGGSSSSPSLSLQPLFLFSRRRHLCGCAAASLPASLPFPFPISIYATIALKIGRRSARKFTTLLGSPFCCCCFCFVILGFVYCVFFSFFFLIFYIYFFLDNGSLAPTERQYKIEAHTSSI